MPARAAGISAPTAAAAPTGPEAFSSEVGTGSRQENASKEKRTFDHVNVLASSAAGRKVRRFCWLSFRHCKRSEAIHRAASRSMDCFVAIAPRHDPGGLAFY